MINLQKNGVLISQTEAIFENDGVLNPGVIKVGDTIVMLYRAVRKGNYSTIGLCKFNEQLQITERNTIPVIAPETLHEAHGVEDPRITLIDTTYYISYTAYDGVNALGALITTNDFITYKRQGIIVPQISFEGFKRFAVCNGPLNEKYERFHVHNNISNNPDKALLLWDKNVVFFPRRIKGKIVFLHRIKPDIQLVCIDELEDITPAFWENYFLHFNKHIVLSPLYKHEVSYIGSGCPPIETDEGWLLIYHGVHDTPNGYVYSACAALLDIDDPTIEISRLPYALFKPEETWELKGVVNNVVFPTGATVTDDTLCIFYGAADNCIATVNISMKELISALLKQVPNATNPTQHGTNNTTT